MTTPTDRAPVHLDEEAFEEAAAWQATYSVAVSSIAQGRPEVLGQLVEFLASMVSFTNDRFRRDPYRPRQLRVQAWDEMWYLAYIGETDLRLWDKLRDNVVGSFPALFALDVKAKAGYSDEEAQTMAVLHFQALADKNRSAS